MSTSVTSVTKHFPVAENGFTTTLASTISSGATTVPLNSVAGYDNGDVVVLVVDPTDVDKKQTFTGTVDTSGVQITGVVWTAGTNQTHTSGSTVVDYATATHVSMISKGILTHADQDGTLKAGAVDNAAVLASDVVTTAKILNDAVTDDKLDYPRWWHEIGRTTLTVAGDTITVSSIPARKYLMVILTTWATGGTVNNFISFNNDTAANYAFRNSSNGTADGTSVSQTNGGAVCPDTANALFRGFVELSNIATQEKFGYFEGAGTISSGAGTAPTRREGWLKWANTTDQINRVDIFNSGGTGDFAIGSEVVVLGHD